MHKSLKFPKESDNFLSETKNNVQHYFTSHKISKFGNKIILQKNIIIGLFLIAIYMFSIWINQATYTIIAFGCIGVLTIILAINVVHDAVHGVAHSKKWINDLLMRQMDLLGPNSYIWNYRHKTGHHTFPNILDNDPDLKQSIIARILPNSPKLSLHRYQHIYLPILYSVYTINWVYIRDFIDIYKGHKKGNMPRKEICLFFFFKSIYLSIFILIPIFIADIKWSIVLSSNLCMHIAASYFLTIALVPSHVSEHSIFPLPDENGVLPFSWSHHQVMTTIDYATKSKIITWMLGGFNHHIVHHLFPEISHIHYYHLTPIVKSTIEKYQLPYQHVDSIFDAYLSHFHLLKNNGLK